MNLKHSELEALDLSNRLIKLDYPYNPKRRPFDPKNSKVFTMIEKQRSNYAALLTAFSKYDTHFQKIPTRHLAQEQNSLAPQWNNGWFPCLDAITLYGLIATTNPKRYVEVGSGNSTMFARQAIKDHRLQTSITSVDPFPRAHIDSICDLVIRTPCEDVATDVFSSLTAGDILLVLRRFHCDFSLHSVLIFNLPQ